MAWAKEIKRKIASIKNTWKITKAMELISTVKMKKAQDAVVSKKDYALELLKIFVKIEDSLWSSPYFSWNIRLFGNVLILKFAFLINFEGNF